jgi:hypothetical protein
MKRISAIIVIAGLSLSSNPSAALAAVNPGAACKKLGEISASPDRKYICIKSGKKLIWGKRVQDGQTPKLAPTDPIAIRVDSLLSTRTGVSGVFLKEVNGLVISDFQSGYVFEPASSIKALVARVVDESEEAFKVRIIDFVARF